MDQTRIAPPKTISRYRIDGVLGSGAMGMVYLAFDQQIQRKVAIKVLHPHLRMGEAGEELEQRFLQEARAAARCTHPNIVTIFDFGIHNGESFIVMEYVKGTELKAYLNQNTAIPLQSACDICVQVLEALTHAHDNGVIHRDIKPANIILLDNAVVKVSDFGVARLDTSDLTGTGMMVGTPNYMSPEARAGEIVDYRSDLYSVGVLLYELLFSQKPDLYVAVSESLDKLDGLGRFGGEKLASIKLIIATALHQKPARRFQHAREFIAALNNLIVKDPTASTTRLVLPQPIQSNRPEVVVSSQNQSQSQWNQDLLSSLEYSLAEFVGPMARLLIRKKSKTTQHFGTLVSSLADHIPNDKERTQFMKKASRSSSGFDTESALKIESGIVPGDDTIPSSLSGRTSLGNVSASLPGQMTLPQATLKKLTTSLAYYVGPLAGRMIKTTMRSTNEPNALLCELARQIPQEDERQKFIKDAKRLF